MKKILTYFISAIWIAFLALLISVPPAYGAIAWVQQASSTIGSNTITSITSTLSSVVAGNSIIVACSNYSGGSITSVTDGVNTYIQDAQNGGISGIQGIYHASNVAVGTHVVSCNGTAGGSGWNIFANEYSGLSNVTSTLVDASSSNNGTSATADPGAITTSNANDLIFGASINNVVSSTVTLAPNFTLRGNGSRAAEPAWDFDQIVSATGTYDASSTYSTSGVFAAASVAYKAAPAVAPTLPTSDITYY